MIRLAVIGDPVGHSLSPLIHMTWIDALGLEASYESIRVPDGETAAALDDLEQQDFQGLNVTLPHKQAVLAKVTATSAAVKAIGAANTLSRLPGGGWHADNTDAPGLIAALARIGFADFKGKTVLVLGAGGAARAGLFALDRAGADIILLNRTVEKAEQVLTECCSRAHLSGPLDALAEHAGRADFVINTTSAGHGGAHIPLPAGDGRLFFDMTYGNPAAVQLAHARAQGWKTEDGLGMLVGQAAESFSIWFDGVRPDIDIALAACRASLEQNL
ncbi:shikimate dehydrogenase [Henriciella barbarensis]|uniref:Shikimate dehydrogenase (NADP(+)) n=1 Tax=Henriciella barbarensis TaxID=86342 RepID=A0A399QZ03_9PROT|nr:shikimate dehydrogenase [Henriciella barbarensis]RIJ24108.1 shikimate dehydrogenase [Henriciella barbarensis]